MTTAIYTLTFFERLTATIPSVDYARLTAHQVMEYIAPDDGPRIVTEKALAPFFIPCLLRRAPFVGKTAQRHPAGAQGQQRSASHVTEAAWWAFDLDDVSTADMGTVLDALDGMLYCAFSTHGHGRQPGAVRMRVLLFADRAMVPADWAAAWRVIDGYLFGGKADPATARLYQACGVWCAHPDRLSQSFREVGNGRPLNVGALLRMAVKPQPRPARATVLPKKARGNQLPRYAAALRWLDAGDYATWQGGLMALRAAVEMGELTDADGRELWLVWSGTAPAERQSRNGATRYEPGTMWDRRPVLATEPAILTGSLFAKARDSAARCVRAELPRPRSARGQQAERYLQSHHRRMFEQMREST